MACVRTEAKSYCLLPELQFLETMKGDVVTNDYDCPLLKACEDIYLINSENILTDISVIHHCSKKCTFIQVS